MSRAEIIARQYKLLIRSSELRVKLIDETQFLKTPLAVADQTRNGFNWLRENPGISLGMLCVTAILKPLQAFRLTSKALMAFGLYKRFKAAFSFESMRRFL